MHAFKQNINKLKLATKKVEITCSKDSSWRRVSWWPSPNECTRGSISWWSRIVRDGIVDRGSVIIWHSDCCWLRDDHGWLIARRKSQGQWWRCPWATHVHWCWGLLIHGGPHRPCSSLLLVMHPKWRQRLVRNHSYQIQLTNLTNPNKIPKHLIIHHIRVQNMKTQQTRSMCTAILNWDQVLRKHFTWVDSAGFGVAHLRMLHVDLKAKLTFPHWGQVQSPSPPRAPVRKILYMRLHRKICNSGFEATHSVSSRKPKVTQQEPYYTNTMKYHSQRNWLSPSSGYSWVASCHRTQLPIALQDNLARCLRTSLTYTQ